MCEVYDCLADEPVPGEYDTLDEALSISDKMGAGYIARAIVDPVSVKEIPAEKETLKRPAPSGELDLFS